MNPAGMGLGLSICKKVCQSLNGDLQVKSKPGLGSIFTFSIAVKKDQNTLDEDDSTSSQTTSERSRMFFKQRKEKLRVQIDKKFKEDINKISEDDQEQLSSSREEEEVKQLPYTI